MTPQEMRANGRQCLSWSESAHYRENREAFFALARAWMSAAIRLEQDNIPLPAAPSDASASRRLEGRAVPRLTEIAIAN